MKVWILMAGEYSDKHLVGVFSSEEKANEFKKRYDNDKFSEYWDPFEHELDALVQDDRLNYFVRMDLESGNNAEAEVDGYYNSVGDVEPHVINNGIPLIYNRILAHDIMEAIKILNEQRIHYLQRSNRSPKKV